MFEPVTKHFDGWMLKNSNNEKSSTLTFAAISFVVTIFSIVGPMVSSHINKPDATLVLGTMGATFLSYVNRRNNSDNNNKGS